MGQGAIAAAGGEQENRLLGLGNDWSGLALGAGADGDGHYPLPA